MKLVKLIPILVGLIILIGCKSESDVDKDYSTRLDFKIENKKFTELGTSRVRDILSENTRRFYYSSRYFYPEAEKGSYLLAVEKKFQLLMENLDTMYFNLELRGHELDSTLLILNEDGTWKYKDSDEEFIRFYQGSKSYIFDVGASGVSFSDSENRIITHKVIQKVNVSGEDHVYMDFKFDVSTYGWYEPDVVYSLISEGSFRGTF